MRGGRSGSGRKGRSASPRRRATAADPDPSPPPTRTRTRTSPTTHPRNPPRRSRPQAEAEKAAASEKAAAAERERAAAEEAARAQARGGAAEEDDEPRERRRKRRHGGGGGGGGSSPLAYLPYVLVAALCLAVLPVAVSKLLQRRAAVKPSADEAGGTPLGAYGGIGTSSVLSDVGSPTPTRRSSVLSTPSMLLGKLMGALRPGPRQPAEGVETNAEVAKFTAGGGGFGPMANANVSFSVEFDDDLEGSTTNSLKGSNLSDDEFDVGGFSAAEDGRARHPTPPAFESAFDSAPALPFPGSAPIPQSRSRGKPCFSHHY